MGPEDYVTIAATINRLRSTDRDAPDWVTREDTLDAVSRALARELGVRNPRFARVPFLAACGVHGE